MRKSHSRGIAGLLCTALATLAANAHAQPDLLTYDHGLVQTSLGTVHFDANSKHNNHQHLIGIELHDTERWFTGAAWFKNSFEQPTWYFYAGREFPLWHPGGDVEIRAKLSGGLLRGYDGDKRDNIPFNHAGIAPAILPSIGARWGHIETDIIAFGTAGMMVTAGLRY